MTGPPLTLGISAFFHNSAAALAAGTEPLAAIEEERLSRIKNDANYPLRAIETCLATTKKSPKQIEMIAFYERPYRALVRNQPGLASRRASLDRAIRTHRQFTTAAKLLFSNDVPLRYFSHHQCHAASAFLCSSFDEAITVIVDGVGEDLAASIWRCRANGMECVWRCPYPHSMGLVYAYVTAHLGFHPMQDEFKVMGLAAHADRVTLPSLSQIVQLGDNGCLNVTPDWIECILTGASRSDGLDEKLLGPRRAPGGAILPEHSAAAAAAQSLLTEWLRRLVDLAFRLGEGCPNLCLAGGVAHNCLGIGQLQADSAFTGLFVQPAAGDAGAALGAALLPGFLLEGRTTVQKRRFNPYLGAEYDTAACQRAIAEAGLVAHPMKYAHLVNRATEALATGSILGWCRGRAEFGPRALGNRSILANPLIPNMSKIVNARIKQREAFRPFAPAVTDSHYDRYFEGRWADAYMMVTAMVREPYRASLSAITNIDGSARVQRVVADLNPHFHQLLEAFGDATGCPMLLNTSLNHSSEPMAFSPADAIRSARLCRLDVLVLGNNWVPLDDAA